MTQYTEFQDPEMARDETLETIASTLQRIATAQERIAEATSSLTHSGDQTTPDFPRCRCGAIATVFAQQAPSPCYSASCAARLGYLPPGTITVLAWLVTHPDSNFPWLLQVHWRNPTWLRPATVSEQAAFAELRGTSKMVVAVEQALVLP